MFRFPVTLLIGSMTLAGCSPSTDDVGVEEDASPLVTKAVCVLSSTDGNRVKGIVVFTEESGGVLVEADLFHLTPGDHGFHVHQWGDLSSNDGTATGGHFNPGGHEHGGPDSSERHAGDLGNVEADRTGYARYKRLDTELSLNGPNSVIGRAIIVHEKNDDLFSQPTGAAGPRAAQGVIGIANP
jgi:Cu-Zn family superoxide dismutase